MCVLVAQLCPTFCDCMDCGPPGSSVHGILQARIRGWIAIPCYWGSFRPRDRTWVSCIEGGVGAVREAPHESMWPMSSDTMDRGVLINWIVSRRSPGCGGHWTSYHKRKSCGQCGQSSRLETISGGYNTCPQTFEELSNGKGTEFFFSAV